MAFSREFHHSAQHRQHPRRHTAEVGHVFLQCLMSDPVTFHLKVREQGSLFLRHPYQVSQRVDVLYEDGAEVTHEASVDVIVRRMATAEYQGTSVEESALGVVAQVESHSVGTSVVVNVVQSVLAHRNKLAFVVGGARRLCIPFHLSRPQNVTFTMPHSVDVALEFLIGVDRHVMREVLISLGSRKSMVTAIFSVRATLDEAFQHVALQLLALGVMPFKFHLTRHEYFSYKLS